jgi:hypothetical protein
VGITTIRATLLGHESLETLQPRLELDSGELEGSATPCANAASALEAQVVALQQEVQHPRAERHPAAPVGRASRAH